MGDGTVAGPHRRIRAAYVPVVRDGRLLFKYDPYRHIVEIQDRRVLYVVDLAQLDANEDAAQVATCENLHSDK